jgi:hypothetical protein
VPGFQFGRPLLASEVLQKGNQFGRGKFHGKPVVVDMAEVVD